MKSSEKKWLLMTNYSVQDYSCGLKSGDFIRLKKDIQIRDHEGNLTGQVRHSGEIWRVLPGAKEDPKAVWLLQPDGIRHTWCNDQSIFDDFELVVEEVFDVVNERDDVVGHAPRREVHARRLLHRAVHVLVFNSRGQLFLQKRSMSKDTAKGKWDSSASGHLDSGEDYDACAVREVWEEIGLKLEQMPGRIMRIEACEETGQEFVWVYRCRSEGPFTLHPEEIECGDWFAPEEVTRWVTDKPGDFARAFVLIWKKLNRL